MRQKSKGLEPVDLNWSRILVPILIVNSDNVFIFSIKFAFQQYKICQGAVCGITASIAKLLSKMHVNEA